MNISNTDPFFDSGYFELTSEEVNRYLKIIKVDMEKPSLYFLKRLVTGTLAYIPFQNLSMLTQERTRPTSQRIKESMLSGLGGLCTVQNPFLFNLLRSLGFQVYYISGTMTQPHCHLRTCCESRQIVCGQ